jgi:hypothetical protein
MTLLAILLTALLIAIVHPSRAPDPLGIVELTTLADVEARQLHGRRHVFWVRLDGRKPNGSEEEEWRYVCLGAGPARQTLWLPDGEDVEAVPAMRGNGLLLVEATLRRIVRRSIRGADAVTLPGIVEYRLERGRV